MKRKYRMESGRENIESGRVNIERGRVNIERKVEESN
jgi:hypothetical protein